MSWTNLPAFTVGQILTSATMNDMRENANIGHLICTSTSRPAAPDEGTMIYETDTDLLYVWTGAAWLQVRRTTDSVATSLLTGTIPTSTLTGTIAANTLTGTVANANLPDGAPTWFAFARAAFPSGINQNALVSVGVPYKSELLIMAAASGFTGAVGLYRQFIAIFGVTGWEEGSYYFKNSVNRHDTFPTAAMQRTVNAGTYTIGCLMNCNTDFNDQATFMVVGRKVA
jgi:hypothetical protein